MRILKLRATFFIFILIGLLMPANFVFALSTDGTIDDTHKYAWGENAGWINFGADNGDVHITDSGLSGYALSETVGWVYLGDIVNDGEGNLSGYAWSENTGWIKFNPTNGGVIINPSGEFTGSALGENIGWVIFNCSTSACVKTDYLPRSARPACNNSLDDDGDGKIDYPDDLGCSSLEDTDETNVSGGLSPGAYNPPSLPSGGFSISIQDGVKYTNKRTVTLKLNGGADAKKIAISNTGDFFDASQEDYQIQKQWNLCSKPGGFAELADCPEGIHRVYVKFYTQYGQPSAVVSDEIILDTVAPEIKISEIKDYYSSAEDVVLTVESEADAEIILKWDKKYGLIHADKQGKVIINLGKMSAGAYQLEMTPTDLAGNKGKILTVNLVIKSTERASESEPEIRSEEPQKFPERPEEQKSIIEKLEPLIPEFLKPKKEEEEKPEEMIVIPEETSLSMRGQWRLLPAESIRIFVLAPLPKSIRNLAQKFPTLKKTFEEVGIVKITDVARLKTVDLTLPGITERAGLAAAKIEPGRFTTPQGVPIANLPATAKQQLPTEIVFAKTGGELIDFNIALSVSEKGEPQQKIATIAGKPLQLVVKPDQPVRSVKGYVVFKAKTPQPSSLEISFNSLLASLTFANPVLAEIQEKPVRVEEKLVLLEFEYTDPDGDGIYTAEIQAPVVDGEYEIITVMDFEDPELGKKEIRLITVVDPEGYIYEKDGDKETRIPGAIISLFWLNLETKQYEIWSAKEYQQENPQTTDVRGTYSFLVPEGYYYLKAEAPGYLIYDGKPFQVKEGSGIHVNIELKTKYWWLKIVDWKTILLAIVIILLLYNFYRDKIREKLLKSKNI